MARLIWIDRIPSGISHDELDYFLGGKFIAFTGSDMTGNWKWWQLTPMQTGTLTAELTALFYVPAGLLLGSSLFAAKVMPAFFGTLIALFGYLLMLRLSKGNRGLSLITALLIVLNPWNFILSRTGYEVTIASFWYLVSIVAYLYIDDTKNKNIRNIWLLAVSLLSLCMGYFSYHGFKFLAPFIVVCVLWGKHFLVTKTVRTKKKLLFPCLYVLLPIGLLLFSLTHYSAYGDRTGEVGIFNLEKYANTVNTQRQLSLTNKLTPVVFNKVTQYAKNELTTYLSFFSPERLFLATNDIFNLNFPNHGYFYLVEIFFVGVGIIVALKDKRFYILFMLLAVAPIPSLVHSGVSYTIRSSFAAIPLTCLSALGLYTIVTRSKFLSLSVSGILAVSIGYFAFLYFNSYGILSADQYMLDYRLLSTYLSRSLNQSAITVISDSPYHIFRDYIFYGNVLNKKNASLFQSQFRSGLYSNYSHNNLLVTSDCDYIKTPPDGQVIVNKGFYISCVEKIRDFDPSFVSKLELSPALTIGSPIDSRAYYRVYNPSICIEDRAGGFIHITQLKQLAIEQMSDKDFCSTWTF